jgi:NADPH:quinone reductase-like Zn-dependent oxidoreductase
MKAVIITRPGGAEVLEVQERAKPEPGVGQIRVRVRASALNRADLMQRAGNYPVPPGVPADTRMEYAGEVDSLARRRPCGRLAMGDGIGGAGHAEYVRARARAMPVPRGCRGGGRGAIPEFSYGV